uniref:BPTI/Kunitz inhibitor domain-containing protein n=1 Tax=Meloidogyne incognita TaxID=6306 RepID=A0A914LN90_MELIC
MNTWNDNYLQTNRISTQPSQKASQHCLEPFDHSIRRPCAIGIWKQRYFFDLNILKCRPFWMDASCFREEIMDGVENNNLKDLNNYFKRPGNLFNNLIECQQICEGRTNEVI